MIQYVMKEADKMPIKNDAEDNEEEKSVQHILTDSGKRCWKDDVKIIATSCI
jgi:hypothetical protein